MYRPLSMGEDKTVTVFKSSLHFVPMIKVQAALDAIEALFFFNHGFQNGMNAYR